MPLIYLLLGPLLNPIIGPIVGIFLIIVGIAAIFRSFELLAKVKWVMFTILIASAVFLYYMATSYTTLNYLFIRIILVIVTLTILIIFRKYFFDDEAMDSNGYGCLLAIGVVLSLVIIIIWVLSSLQLSS